MDRKQLYHKLIRTSQPNWDLIREAAWQKLGNPPSRMYGPVQMGLEGRPELLQMIADTHTPHIMARHVEAEHEDVKAGLKGGGFFESMGSSIGSTATTLGAVGIGGYAFAKSDAVKNGFKFVKDTALALQQGTLGTLAKGASNLGKGVAAVVAAPGQLARGAAGLGSKGLQAAGELTGVLGEQFVAPVVAATTDVEKSIIATLLDTGDDLVSAVANVGDDIAGVVVGLGDDIASAAVGLGDDIAGAASQVFTGSIDDTIASIVSSSEQIIASGLDDAAGIFLAEQADDLLAAAFKVGTALA